MEALQLNIIYKHDILLSYIHSTTILPPHTSPPHHPTHLTSTPLHTPHLHTTPHTSPPHHSTHLTSTPLHTPHLHTTPHTSPPHHSTHLTSISLHTPHLDFSIRTNAGISQSVMHANKCVVLNNPLMPHTRIQHSCIDTRKQHAQHM